MRHGAPVRHLPVARARDPHAGQIARERNVYAIAVPTFPVKCIRRRTGPRARVRDF